MIKIKDIISKKFRIVKISDKGYTVQVKVNGYWKHTKYDGGHDEHPKGQFPMFDTYNDAVEFGKEHTEGDYTIWVK